MSSIFLYPLLLNEKKTRCLCAHLAYSPLPHCHTHSLRCVVHRPGWSDRSRSECRMDRSVLDYRLEDTRDVSHPRVMHHVTNI